MMLNGIVSGVPARSAPTNPFTFGDLALDEAFTDREAEIRELKSDVLNGQNVVIFAPRRYGKSSLVWRVTQELLREDVLVAQVNLMTTPTKERFAEKLAKSIYDDIASPLFRAKERLRAFRGLRIAPTLTLDPEDGSVGFSFAAARHAGDVDATVERLLEIPAQLAAERGRRVALVLDEFQQIVEIDPHLPALMRSVFQEQPEVAHVYLGSKRHMMERIFNDENEPFWRSAKKLELGLIAPELFRDYIRHRFVGTSRGVAEETIAAVLEITHGHPYGTQELCYHLWEKTPPGATAAQAELAAGLESTLRSENAHFSDLWEKTAGGQKTLLQALAAEPGRPLSTDYRRRHGLGGASSVQKAVATLVKDELVLREADGAYRIAEPFFAEWIARSGS